MPDPVLIEFRTDISQLVEAVDELERLGLVDKQVADESRKAAAGLKEQNRELEKQGKATKDLKLNINELIEELKDMPEEIIAQANVQTMDKAADSTKKLTTQLREMKDELARLEIAGKGNTKEFQDIAIQAAKLEDQIGDTSTAIRVLASDTKYIDGLISGVQGLAGAFAVVQGTTALFGDENENLQKSLLKVNAAMAIMQGLQQVQLVLQKQSAASIVLTSVAQRTWNFVIGETTGLLKAMRIALAATGLGLIILALYEGAKAMGVFNSASDDAIDKQQELRDEVDRLNSVLKEQFDIQQRGANQTIADLKRTIDVRKSDGASAAEIYKLEELLLQKKAQQYRIAAKTFVDGSQEQIDALEAVKDTVNEITILEINYAKTVKEQGEQAAKFRKEASEAEIRDRIALIETNILLEKEGTRKMIELQIALLDERRRLQLANANLTKNEAEKIYLESQILIDGLKDQLAELNNPSTSIVNSVIPDVPALEEQSLKGLETIKDFHEKAKEISAQHRQDAIDDLDAIEAHRREIFNQSVQLAQQTLGVLSQISQTHLDSELSNLQLQLEHKAISQAQYEQKVRQAKRKDAENAKAIALFETTINTASAIVEALPNIPLSILSAVLGAAQFAVIASQPIPAFRKGTKKAPSGFKWVGEEGPELINDGGGYAILNNTDSEKLAGISNKYALNLPSLPDFSLPISGLHQTLNTDFDRMAKAFSKELRKNPGLNVNIDQSGFEVYMKSALRQTEYLDGRYQSNG